jgi:hypothetical protein
MDNFFSSECESHLRRTKKVLSLVINIAAIGFHVQITLLCTLLLIKDFCLHVLSCLVVDIFVCVSLITCCIYFADL